MNLEDLYKKAVSTDGDSFEVLRSDGALSGHRITLKPLFSDCVTLAQMRYNRVLNAAYADFKANNKDLHDECEKLKDFTEYNFKFDLSLVAIKNAFAAELVAGWDFDNEFNESALNDALLAFNKPLNISLASQIINALQAAIIEHSKK